ncbi:MAG: metallophosphoesterase [Proteobacteria bacterium]|nr:metallophosphoesterase [Pseudomonadota bacterium]
MARRIKLLVFLSLILLLAAVLAWRFPAPTWHGQNLELTLDAGPSLDMLMIGDSGSGLPDQFKVAEAMERYCLNHHLDAVFMLGDNFYPAGVKSASDPQWLTKFTDPYGKPCLSQVPFYAILGNHDYKGDPSAQIAYSEQQSFWHMPHRFYSVQFGKLAKIVGIDTNILDLCGSASHCTLDFLRKAISKKEVPIQIVIGHHPIASASSTYPKTAQGWLLQQLLCNRDIIYISGHSHHMEHRQISDCSLDLFINGGAGASLYSVRQGDTETKYASSTHGFLSLNLTREQSTFTFYDSQLQSLYSYRRKNIE